MLTSALRSLFLGEGLDSWNATLLLLPVVRSNFDYQTSAATRQRALSKSFLPDEHRSHGRVLGDDIRYIPPNSRLQKLWGWRVSPRTTTASSFGGGITSLFAVVADFVTPLLLLLCHHSLLLFVATWLAALGQFLTRLALIARFSAPPRGWLAWWFMC